jgi:hypothetical protein
MALVSSLGQNSEFVEVDICNKLKLTRAVEGN